MTPVSQFGFQQLLGALFLLSAPVLANWPCWRGPRADGSTGERLLPDGKSLTLSPPAWEREVGEGCGSVVVFQGRVYSTGWRNDRESVFCLDAVDGRVLWSQQYATPRFGRHAVGDQGWYSGPTATPSLDPDTGWLYTLSADGDVRCWDTAAAGRLVWALNLYERYGVPRRPNVGGGQRDFGFTTAPFIWGEDLLLAVGPPAGLLVALDKRTAARRWVSECKDFASNSGGMSPLQVQGIPGVAILSLTRLVIVRLDPGRQGVTFAEYPWQTDYANNLVTPTVVGGRVLLSSDYNQKKTVLLQIAPGRIAPVWESRRYSGVGSPALHGEHLYLPFKTLRCLRVADGTEVWNGGRFGPDGSCLVTADGLVVAAGSGALAIVESAARHAASYRELASLNGLCARNQAWPHVVLSDGRIYLKDRGGRIRCLRVAAHAPEEIRPDNPKGTTPPAAALQTTARPVFAWRAGDSERGLRRRGAASIAADGSLELAGGAFEIPAEAERVLAACRRSHALLIEVEFTAHNTSQTGPARIVSFSADPYRRNFTLGQDKDRLVLRLRTPVTGENGMKPETTLGRVVPGRRHRVVVSYVPGRLICRLDGVTTVDTDSVRGDFSNWAPSALLVGNEATADRPWHGQLHALTIGAGRTVGASSTDTP